MSVLCSGCSSFYIYKNDLVHVSDPVTAFDSGVHGDDYYANSTSVLVALSQRCTALYLRVCLWLSSESRIETQAQLKHVETHQTHGLVPHFRMTPILFSPSFLLTLWTSAFNLNGQSNLHCLRRLIFDYLRD